MNKFLFQMKHYNGCISFYVDFLLFSVALHNIVRHKKRWKNVNYKTSVELSIYVIDNLEY